MSGWGGAFLPRRTLSAYLASCANADYKGHCEFDARSLQQRHDDVYAKASAKAISPKEATAYARSASCSGPDVFTTTVRRAAPLVSPTLLDSTTVTPRPTQW